VHIPTNKLSLQVSKIPEGVLLIELLLIFAMASLDRAVLGRFPWVNEAEDEEGLHDLRVSVNKGRPFGTMGWTEHMVERFGLGLTLRDRGRPKNNG